LFISSAKDRFDRDGLKAAYVGASNGDDPQFYSIFSAAMAGAGVTDCRMIMTSPSGPDLDFINEAELILLAGGDVERGWRAFEQNGLDRIIPRRREEGALLMGVSAGAVHLGTFGYPERASAPGQLFRAFGLVPFIVGAHEEADGWRGLASAVSAAGEGARGVGLPSGAGIIYHPDDALEPVRHPAHELVMNAGRLEHNLLPPSRYKEAAGAPLAR
jgi:hypothetical protein